MTLKIAIVTAQEIERDVHQVDRWRAFLDASSGALASPYFSPEFTLAAAAVRDDVRVAVLMDDAARTVGFFPFQTGAPRAPAACAPVGGLLSDHHGAVVAADVDMRGAWPAILKAAQLEHWRFDHLVASQAPPVGAPFVFGAQLSASPCLRLSEGFATYRARLGARTRRLADLDRKARKLAREVGPLRFVAQARGAAAASVLRHIVEKKSAQCRSTGVVDYFGELPWTRALVERIAALDGDAQASVGERRFRGAVSALYAGDALVAAHMGMRSERVWHWWFPVYDHAWASYSPGSLLVLKVAEAAADAGAELLDLGKGDDRYKSTFADASIPIAEGFVARASAWNAARGAYVSVSQWARPRLRPAVRALRRVADQLYAPLRLGT